MTDWKKFKNSSPWIVVDIPNKITYNEGTYYSQASNPVFGFPPGGESISFTHDFCGYWHIDNIPTVFIHYSSEMYAIEFMDAILTGIISLSDGVYRSVVVDYDNGVEAVKSNMWLSDGVYRSTVFNTAYMEALRTGNISLVAGVYKSVINFYTLETESVLHAATFTSGLFRHAVLTSQMDVEAVSHQISLTTGVYEDAN